MLRYFVNQNPELLGAELCTRFVHSDTHNRAVIQLKYF